VTERFVSVILKGEGELIANGPEGIKSVMIANGIMLSSFTKQSVNVPFDSDEYERIMDELILTSSFTKNKVRNVVVSDLTKSFSS
jgi:hypothetical protein